MTSTIAKKLVVGILGGSLLGYLIGRYAVHETIDLVVNADEYKFVLERERDRIQYSAFVTCFSVIGFAILVTLGSFSPYQRWIRPTLYGFLSGLIVVVSVTCIAAAITGQKPVFYQKGTRDTCLEIGRKIGIPIGATLGPLSGLLYASIKRRSDQALTLDESDPIDDRAPKFIDESSF